MWPTLHTMFPRMLPNIIHIYFIFSGTWYIWIINTLLVRKKNLFVVFMAYSEPKTVWFCFVCFTTRCANIEFRFQSISAGRWWIYMGNIVKNEKILLTISLSHWCFKSWTCVWSETRGSFVHFGLDLVYKGRSWLFSDTRKSVGFAEAVGLFWFWKVDSFLRVHSNSSMYASWTRAHNAVHLLLRI